jgi:hypothetical protein
MDNEHKAPHSLHFKYMEEEWMDESIGPFHLNLIHIIKIK